MSSILLHGIGFTYEDLGALVEPFSWVRLRAGDECHYPGHAAKRTHDQWEWGYRSSGSARAVGVLRHGWCTEMKVGRWWMSGVVSGEDELAAVLIYSLVDCKR